MGERKEKGGEFDIASVDELPVNPKNTQLIQPVKKRTSVKKVFVVAWKFLKKGVISLKYLWIALRFLGKTIAAFFHRVPRFKPVNNKREAEVVQFSLGTNSRDEKRTDPISQTTTDIKVLPKNPLRYPEPVPEKNRSSAPERVSRYFKKGRVTRYSNLSAKTDSKTGITKNVEKNVCGAGVSEKEALENEADKNLPLEKTVETKTKNKRRIVGLATSKKESKLNQEVYFSADVSENLENKEDVLATKSVLPKTSLVMRGEYVLDNETDEIGDQIEQGRYGVAESALIDVLSKNPRNSEAYRLLGIVYLKRKDFAQATEVFEEALRRDPEHKGLHGPLGFCYMSVGEYGKALSMYQQAHSMDETNIEYLEQLLVISSRMDRQPLAKMIAKKVLALDPDHQLAKKYLERIAVR